MFEYLPLQFDYTSDFVQGSWYTLTIFPRIKTIHAVGVVQKIRWVSIGDHGYTGIFQGDDYGLIRYSMPSPNNAQKWGEDSSQVVGIAVKFFREGVHSGNIHAMNGFKGTKTPNFFEN